MESTCSITRLADWRAKKGWSLHELADLTGYTAGFLSRVERGERALSAEAKVVIARRLGVPIRELFEVGEGPDGDAAA